MEVNNLIAALERNEHVCRRDPDGKPAAWIEGGRLMLVIDGKPLFQREAEQLVPWAQRFSN
jgi:hypothetical protein